jgi:hypothetical protein
MKRSLRPFVAIALLLAVGASSAFAADAKPATLTCVGLYSEISDGYVSYRVGTGDWIVVKVGDLIPLTAEFQISVERDWAEFIQTGKPETVYEITGSDKGKVTKKVQDLIKEKGRTVKFPNVAKGADPAFKDKLIVTQYLGRQVYRNASLDRKDVKYGDILENKGTVQIIAINNTITLMNDKGAVTTVIGPLKFDIEKVLTNQNLYKFLNVAK